MLMRVLMFVAVISCLHFKFDLNLYKSPENLKKQIKGISKTSPVTSAQVSKAFKSNIAIGKEKCEAFFEYHENEILSIYFSCNPDSRKPILKNLEKLLGSYSERTSTLRGQKYKKYEWRSEHQSVILIWGTGHTEIVIRSPARVKKLVPRFGDSDQKLKSNPLLTYDKVTGSYFRLGVFFDRLTIFKYRVRKGNGLILKTTNFANLREKDIKDLTQSIRKSLPKTQMVCTQNGRKTKMKLSSWLVGHQHILVEEEYHRDNKNRLFYWASDVDRDHLDFVYKRFFFSQNYCSVKAAFAVEEVLERKTIKLTERKKQLRINKTNFLGHSCREVYHFDLKKWAEVEKLHKIVVSCEKSANYNRKAIDDYFSKRLTKAYGLGIYRDAQMQLINFEVSEKKDSFSVVIGLKKNQGQQ